MKIRYRVVKTWEINEDNTVYAGYGLHCTMGGESAEVKNVFPGRAEAERLAELLVREAVEPVHLLDVVSDLLAGGFSDL